MELLVLDTNLQTVDVVDTFESLIWTDRYDKCGDFEIYTYASLDNINLFKDDYFLWSRDSDHAMIIEEIANEHPEISVCKVNVDVTPEFAIRYNVVSIPTLILFENGKVSDIKVGLVGKDTILKMLS